MSEALHQPEQNEQEPVRIDLFSPEITAAFEAAPIYAKLGRATARPAVAGEVVDSVLSNGHKQTSRTAVEGEVVVTYESGEQVIQEPEVFNSRWEPTEEEGVFRAKGLSRIIPNPTDRDFTVVTHWGIQEGKADYLLAAVYDPANPDTVSDDRYAIGREVYETSFAPAEQVYGFIPGQR